MTDLGVPQAASLEQIKEYEERQRQMIAAFNLYRTPGVHEALPAVQISAWYHGILVEGPARVLEMRPESVVFAVGVEQARALEHSRFAFVESTVHGTCFRSRMTKSVDGTCNVELSLFERFKDYMERRRLSRASPVNPMLVRLAHGRHHVRGRVMDLSATSLAALFERRALERLTQLRDVELDVWGEHEGDTRLVDFHASGSVLQVKNEFGSSPAATRLVISLKTYPALIRTLNTYVARREREIMSTLAADAH